MGYLYVIEFNTGAMKVGKAVDPAKRIGQHRKDGLHFGVEVARSWHSEDHANYDANERELIRFCREHWPVVRQEFFQGADFSAVVAFAEDLPPDIPEGARRPSVLEGDDTPARRRVRAPEEAFTAVAPRYVGEERRYGPYDPDRQYWPPYVEGMHWPTDAEAAAAGWPVGILGNPWDMHPPGCYRAHCRKQGHIVRNPGSRY